MTILLLEKCLIHSVVNDLYKNVPPLFTGFIETLFERSRKELLLQKELMVWVKARMRKSPAVLTSVGGIWHSPIHTLVNVNSFYLFRRITSSYFSRGNTGLICLSTVFPNIQSNWVPFVLFWLSLWEKSTQNARIIARLLYFFACHYSKTVWLAGNLNEIKITHYEKIFSHIQQKFPNFKRELGIKHIFFCLTEITIIFTEIYHIKTNQKIISKISTI